jgi:hypothetical protein
MNLLSYWIATEVSRNRFTIRTDHGGVKVSWQITNIREDAWEGNSKSAGLRPVGVRPPLPAP